MEWAKWDSNWGRAPGESFSPPNEGGNRRAAVSEKGVPLACRQWEVLSRLQRSIDCRIGLRLPSEGPISSSQTGGDCRLLGRKSTGETPVWHPVGAGQIPRFAQNDVFRLAVTGWH